MRIKFRNVVTLLLLTALSFAAPAVYAKEKEPAKTKAAAIQVLNIQSNGIALPVEFQISLYEKLIAQLQQRAVFQRVYREGDQNATAPDMITLQCTAQSFKKGSERLRQVTMVAGATSMTLRCEFRDKGGISILARDITGKVRFFGGNLKATDDFAKKAAKLADENFSSAARRSENKAGIENVSGPFE
jgi:hypothetical protein